jgi:hypothetical protein
MRPIALLALAAVSCSDSPWQWTTTPVGYLAGWKYEPAPAEALTALDSAIDRAVYNVSVSDGISMALLYDMLDGYRYYLFPGAFETDDSQTGWASGQALPGAMALAWRLPGSTLDYPALEHEIRHEWYRSATVGH